MRESSTRRNLQYSIVYFYDRTFGRLVRRRIARAIDHMNIADGEFVLDLGIGTGQSLQFYPGSRQGDWRRSVQRMLRGLERRSKKRACRMPRFSKPMR